MTDTDYSETAMDSYASEGLVMSCFGIFCAYWAQETDRNAFLWFFLGLLFGPITGLALLVLNSAQSAPQSG